MKTLQSKLQSPRAFTLVELIVVIVILAILATIAFLSFSSQSGSARDSTRLSDIASIKKGLEMHNASSGNYPSPDDSAAFTYSGGILWNQGKLGDKAHRLISKTLSKKVKDPLKDEDYDYSLAANRREYQVAGNLENPTSFGKDFNPFDISDLSPRLSALGGTGANVHISGNYNGVVLKVFTGSAYHYVPTPTLFGVDAVAGSNIVYDGNFGSGKDLLPGFNNLARFDSTKIYSTGGTSMSDSDISSLMMTIKEAYQSGNVSTPAVQQVLAASGTALTDIGKGLIKNALGGNTSIPSSGTGGSSVPDAYTVLLMHFDGNSNNTGTNTGTVNNLGAVTFDGAGKFGGAANFSGSNYLSIPDSADWSFGSSDYTIDFWINAKESVNQRILAQYQDNNNRMYVHMNGTNYGIGYGVGGAWALNHDLTNTFPINTWRHIAITRQGNTYRYFIDGVLNYTTVQTYTIPDYNSPLYIGADYWNSTAYQQSKILLDELRISKGVARWSTGFTVPNAPY